MTFNFNVGGITPQDVNTGGSGGETLTGGVLPKNIAGLVMCLDGEINSRAGIHDESINGMQNLVYSPLIGYTTGTGAREVLNGTSAFTDKGCTLGGTCFYPDYNNNEMTVEFCVEITRSAESLPLNLHFIANRTYQGGWQIWIGDPDKTDEPFSNSVVKFQAFTSDMTQTKNTSAKFSQTYGEKIYYTVTTKLNEANSTKIYMNGELVTNLDLYEDGIATVGGSKVNVGMGGYCNTSTESITPTSSNPFNSGSFYGNYLKWYMFRKWSRRLTPEEIKQNYLQDKKRFG